MKRVHELLDADLKELNSDGSSTPSMPARFRREAHHLLVRHRRLRETGASNDGAPGGKAGADRRAGTELRSTRHDTVGNSRPKDAEA